ncbi:MAG: hypothetical protein J6T19_06365 [Paludibacteraceae bacterium]|nr:hypothetical protein [Paludibacteraceae bacterium]
MESEMWGEISQENRIGTEGAPSKNKRSKMCGIFGKKCGFYGISGKICVFLEKKFGDMKKKY